MGLFWELRQQNMISGASRDAISAKHKANETMVRLVQAERRAEKALLVCEALWTLVRERLNLTDEQLNEQIHMLDLTDGKLDGKVRREPKRCPSCGRVTPQRMAECLYCGQDLPSTPFAV